MFRSFETGRSEELFRPISLVPLCFLFSLSLTRRIIFLSTVGIETHKYTNVDGTDRRRGRAIMYGVREGRHPPLRVLLPGDRTGNPLLLQGAPGAGECRPCAVQNRCSKLIMVYALQLESVHKLVCGGRSHPFRLPPFSCQEANLVLTCAAPPIKGSKDALLKLQILQACGVHRSNELRVSDGDG